MRVSVCVLLLLALAVRLEASWWHRHHRGHWGHHGGGSPPPPALPPLRAVTSGDLFLGGDFIEVGINAANGVLGSSAAKPAGFQGTYASSGVTPSPRLTIGMVYDMDGFVVGPAPDVRTDLFANDGAAYSDAWSVAGLVYQSTGAGFCTDGVDCGVLSGVSASTTLGTTATATITGTTNNNLQVAHTYTLVKDAHYLQVDVTITNTLEAPTTPFSYARFGRMSNGICTDASTSANPCTMGTPTSGTATTISNIECQKTANADGFAVITEHALSTAIGMDASYYAADCRAAGAFFTDPTPSDLTAAPCSVSAGPQALAPFGIAFKLDALKSGDSTSFRYYIAMDIDEYLPPPTFATGCVCGNGVLDRDGAIDHNEGCDDGNKVDGDGCDSTCALENGYQCATPGSACMAATCSKLGPQQYKTLQAESPSCGDGGQFTGTATTCTYRCADGYYPTGESATSATFTCKAGEGYTASYTQAGILTCGASTCTRPTLSSASHELVEASWCSWTGHFQDDVHTNADTCRIACSEGYQDPDESYVEYTCTPDKDASTASYKALDGTLSCGAVCTIPTANTFNPHPWAPGPFGKVKYFAQVSPITDHGNCPQNGKVGDDECLVKLSCPYRYSPPTATATLSCVTYDNGNAAHYAFDSEAAERQCSFDGLPRNQNDKKPLEPPPKPLPTTFEGDK